MRLTTLLLAALATGCTDVRHPLETNDNELITTVVLTFTDLQGTSTEFSWSDPENDGDPVIEQVALSSNSVYSLSVGFFNELATPTEELTDEVRAEAEHHQVFFTGESVDDGLVTYSYTDTDAVGLPVGLQGDLVTDVAGEGSFVVTLRHLPPQDGQEVKGAGLTETVNREGFESIPGNSDVQVVFPLFVADPEG